MLFTRFLSVVLLIVMTPIMFVDEANASPAGSANPDISVNALMLYKNSNRGYDSTLANRNGASLQEAEMQFASDVDPYWRFVGTFSLGQEVNQDKQTATPRVYEAKWNLSPEEVFAESLDFSRFTIRVGKFKASVGKHNQLHTHAYPFIDAPLQNQLLLGDEGLNDIGVSVATLLPLPWYSEIVAQVFSGQAVDYYKASTASGGVALLHLKNLWDLSDQLTAELGLSGATGNNSTGTSTNLYGLDLTFKWRQSLERAVIWSTEVLRRDVGASQTEVGQGLASWLQFQPARRWWFEVRGEYLEVKNPVLATGAPFQRKQSLVAAFDPSEFSEIRIQGDHLNDGTMPDEYRGLLQLNYTIGAHPAHAY